MDWEQEPNPWPLPRTQGRGIKTHYTVFDGCIQSRYRQMTVTWNGFDALCHLLFCQRAANMV